MKRSNVHGLLITGLLITGSLIAGHWLFAQGALTPPGPPAPMFKTLQEIEPRTPISLLPYSITNSGSYYVTTNLTGTNGITIAANGVTLDLMGFELVGGLGDGISINGNQTNIAIRNGTLRNWTGNGVRAFLVWNTQFEALRASGNGGAGIWTGEGSLVIGCTASGNAAGIQAGQSSTVSGCAGNENSVLGIFVGAGSTMSGCTASRNGGVGIDALERSTVSGCVARVNAEDGIRVASYSSVRDNVCAHNGTGISSGAGIFANGTDIRMEGNLLIGNDFGIRCPGAGNIVLRNSASDNTGSPQFGATADYDFSDANTTYGPIVSRTSGELGIANFENHPWANFRY